MEKEPENGKEDKKMDHEDRPGHRWILLAVTIGAMVAALAIVGAALIPSGPAAGSIRLPFSRGAKTADAETLHTWWQDNAEKQADAPVKDQAVRQSPFYSMKVAPAKTPANKFDSFTYLSLPRSGNPKIGYTEEDGAEFAANNDMSMSWSTFEYAADALIEVSLDTGQTINSADQVTIRPTGLGFDKKLMDDHTVRITVPYARTGYRFSVEFQPQQVTVYNDNTAGSGHLTMSPAGGASRVETEPRNAMMVFAQPKMDTSREDGLVPDKEAENVYLPKPGKLTREELESLPDHVDTLYFAPGTYYMGGQYRSELANVRWIYLAPGAYVKGAFKFLSTSDTDFRITGYGVLSGEQYVYEADTTDGYKHLAPGKGNCWSSCVKMLQFQSPQSGPKQTLLMRGITVATPPYHSFVMYGNEDGDFQMEVNNYQQVGGWYWQTDGLELYKGSSLRNSFLHSNDDVIKLYHSDVSVDNNVIWKVENGPVFQWGWGPRTISRIQVSNTDVIHNRMWWRWTKNHCIFNSSPSIIDVDSTATADTTQEMTDVSFVNTNVEGMVNCVIRIYALEGMKRVTIDGLHVESWNKMSPEGHMNNFTAFTDPSGRPVTIGNQVRDHEGLLIKDYTVGGVTILKSKGNWASNKLGRLDFDGRLWENWDTE